jgi:hypothetical protein
VKNRGEGKRIASSSGEWFLAIFPTNKQKGKAVSTKDLRYSTFLAK